MVSYDFACGSLSNSNGWWAAQVGYCYSRHNSAGRGLGIYPGWVVIQRTFSFLRGGSGPGFGAVWPVGIVRTFSCSQQLPRRKAAVFIGGTIPRASFSAQGCY